MRILSYTSQIINFAVLENGRVSCVVSLVYASPSEDMGDLLYRYVEEMACQITTLWILIGDLNQVLKQEDKRGGRIVHGRGVTRMQRMVDVCELMEVDFCSPRFTWSNGQKGHLRIEQ